jgi:hypothetical protein
MPNPVLFNKMEKQEKQEFPLNPIGYNLLKGVYMNTVQYL